MIIFVALLIFAPFQATLANPRIKCRNALGELEHQVIEDAEVDQQKRETILNGVTRGFVESQQYDNNFGSQACLRGVLFCTNIIRYNVRLLTAFEKNNCCANCFKRRYAEGSSFSNSFG